jgi:hypothetical protein
MQLRIEAWASAGRGGHEGQKTSNRLRIARDHDLFTLGQGLLSLGPV